MSHSLRWATLACLILAFVPLMPAMMSNEAPGAGPDVHSTLWGMWWFQQSWMGAAWSGWTDLANHPYGAWGTVLSPSSALVWALLDPIVGPARASTLVSWIQISGLALSTAWLGRTAGLSPMGAGIAGFSVLVGRLLMFGLGEGSVVAITTLPIPLGLVGLMRLQRERERGWKWILLSVACMGWTSLENPYLAPVLPGMAVLMMLLQGVLWWQSSDARSEHQRAMIRLGISIVMGLLSVGLVAWMFSRSANPDYPNVDQMAGETATLLGITFDIVDLEHARAVPTEWVIPGEVRWTLDAETAAQSGGGRYLGVSVFLLAFVGAVYSWRRSWIWSTVAMTCLALSLGSLVYGVGGVFLYLNGVMSWIARPLTQPTRFLTVALVALAVLAGFGFDVLRQRFAARARWVGASIAGLLLLDFVWVGGASLQLPTTPLPGGACVQALEDPDGAVMVWPWDAIDGAQGRSQLLQILHERPAAHTGIASWRPHKKKVTKELRDGGLNPVGASGKSRFNVNHYQDRNFRYLIVELGAGDPDQQAWMEAQLDKPVAECDGLRVYDLGTHEERAPPESPPVSSGS